MVFHLHLWKNIFKKRVVPSNSVVSGLRHQSEFYNSHNLKTVYDGTETLQYIGPKIWDILPKNEKNSTNLENVQTKYKKMDSNQMPLRIVPTIYSRIRVYLIYDILLL